MLNFENQTDCFLTFYFIPSPHGVDWKSPRSTLISNLKNQLSLMPRKLGHVNVELSRAGKIEELTGMYSPRMDSIQQILLKGAGFGVMWHSFPGALEKKEDLLEELPAYIKVGRLSFLRLKISLSVFDRLKNYLTDYQELNVQKNYGLANRPLHKEGAGCTAFAVSFLDAVDLLPDVRNQWRVELNVPERLIGSPLRGQYVPISRIAFTKNWAEPTEKYKNIVFWDPDKMHNWVLRNTNLTVDRAPGHFLDVSTVEVHNSPLWRA